MRRAEYDAEGPFQGMRPQRPPAELRPRALAAAAAAISHPRPDLWSRLWMNRPLRVAWAAALVLLVSGHFVVTGAPGRPSRAVGLATAGPAEGLDPEIMDIVDLPRISSESLTGLP